MQPIRLRDRLRHSWAGMILAEHDTEPSELWTSAALVLYGGWLLLPLSTYTMSQVYTALMILPEWAWGVAFVLVGLGQAVALRNGCRSWRRFTALLTFLVWFSLGAAFLWGAPASAGAIVFLAFAGLAGWCYIRLGGAA